MGPLGTQTDYLKNEEAITAIMASGSRSNSVCRRKKMMDRLFEVISISIIISRVDRAVRHRMVIG